MMTSRNASPIATASVLFLILSVLFCSPDLHAGSRQRAVAVSPPSSELSLTFVDGGSSSSIVDAGAISWKGGRRRVTVTKKKFGVRIGRPSREARGTATLRAFLETPDPRATIRIDGILVSGSAPVVIEHHAPVGITVTHVLEIEIPVTAPDGPLAATIGWEVTTE